MPELPEVESVCRILRASKVMNSVISQILVNKDVILRRGEINRENFDKLIGRTIKNIERKGKLIIFHFDNNKVLLVHLRMTGKFILDDQNNKDLIVFIFDNKHTLSYQDPRSFGVFYLRDQKNFTLLPPYKDIGPDVIQETISIQYLVSCFKSRKNPIHATLLDQKIVSGIGNIYSSEILFASKINPLKNTNQLTIVEIEQLIKNAKLILLNAIKCNGSSVVDFLTPHGKKGSYHLQLRVYKRDNQPCYNCQSLIITKKINSRNSFFCPQCQKS